MLDQLPPQWRLAVAYAPVATRDRWASLLALDCRLASVVRSAREPMLAQMRLAWWRDRLSAPSSQWPKGEPLLAALACWQGAHGVLTALVDGWEAMLEPAPLPQQALAGLVDGRVAAVQALAGDADVALMARGWALADLAVGTRDPAEQAIVQRWIAEHDWQSARLPKGMRPLVVLHGIAARGRGDALKMQKVPLFTLMRLGLIGV